MSAVNDQNRRTWDERARGGAWHTEPAGDDDFRDPLAAADPLGWLGGNVRGRRVLCLAAGGGKHGPLLAAAGAEVTVVDLSPAMLEADRRVAAARGLALRTVAASMDRLEGLGEGTFDFVLQPVSTCYVPDVVAVYREVARVTVPGGIYVSQHKQPAALQAGARPEGRGYVMAEPYYRTEPLPPAAEGWGHREAGAVEFLHRWTDLLGGLCRSGFVMEDLMEPRHGDPRAEPGTFAHRCQYLPPFVAVKARRSISPGAGTGAGRLWTPG